MFPTSLSRAYFEVCPCGPREVILLPVGIRTPVERMIPGPPFVFLVGAPDALLSPPPLSCETPRRRGHIRAGVMRSSQTGQLFNSAHGQTPSGALCSLFSFAHLLPCYVRPVALGSPPPPRGDPIDSWTWAKSDAAAAAGGSAAGSYCDDALSVALTVLSCSAAQK